jgi:hypothetical protein
MRTGSPWATLNLQEPAERNFELEFSGWVMVVAAAFLGRISGRVIRF